MTSSPASNRYSSRALISSRSSTAKVPASSRLYSSQNPSGSHTSNFTRLRWRLKNTRNTWPHNGSWRAAPPALVPLQLDRTTGAGSAAPRATKNSYRPWQRQHALSAGPWSTRRSVSLSAPAGGTRTRCPLGATISSTAAVLGTSAGAGTSVNTTGFSAATHVAVLIAAVPEDPPPPRQRVLSAIPCLSPNSRSVKPATPASPPTLAASAVPALMSSIPTFPWIPSSESILRYRPITGEMELVTRLPNRRPRSTPVRSGSPSTPCASRPSSSALVGIQSWLHRIPARRSVPAD